MLQTRRSRHGAGRTPGALRAVESGAQRGSCQAHSGRLSQALPVCGQKLWCRFTSAGNWSSPSHARTTRRVRRRPAEDPPLPQPLARARPTAPRLPCTLRRDADRDRPGDRDGRHLDSRPVGERRQRPRGPPAGTPDRAREGTPLAPVAGGCRHGWRAACGVGLGCALVRPRVAWDKAARDGQSRRRGRTDPPARRRVSGGPAPAILRPRRRASAWRRGPGRAQGRAVSRPGPHRRRGLRAAVARGRTRPTVRSAEPLVPASVARRGRPGG